MVRKGCHLSEEHKRKISKARIGQHLSKPRKPLSEEARKHISETQKGKHLSEETKKKIGDFNRGKIVSEETRKKLSKVHKGRMISEETKKKMSEAAKNRIVSEETRKKISRALIYIGHHPISRKGIHFSVEHKRKLSLSKSGKTWEEIYKNENVEEKKRTASARMGFYIPKYKTSIEYKIQDFLRELNFDFISQKFINDIIHQYRCDIFIPKYNLIIECDGNYWHHYPEGREIDRIRTNELMEKGYKVLRLWEHDIRNMNIETFKWKLSNSQELLYPICIS